MASNNIPPQIIEDDEDAFDWEAAVREIDVACDSTTKPSTSHSANLFSHSTKDKKKGSSSRQSTLDKFFGNRPPAPQLIEEHNDEDDDRKCYLDIDPEAAKTWIYPVNIPVRDYQLAITKKALFSNTLVALPTGLGKTLIAAVVMYNYFRWFPDGKIVFTAPSRPLVMQQIEACHNIVGIPQEWTIDMTGQMNPAKRVSFWKTKRVFFVTPQVLEKDIQSGTCLVKYLVCLVIDEAHRAMGNFAYCTAVRELMSVPVQLRILALSATPGSKQQTTQQIIDNLHISALEYRNESDHDVSPYVHNRKIELIQVAMGNEATEIHSRIMEIIRPYVTRLCASGLLQNRDYENLSPYEIITSRKKFQEAPPTNLPHNKIVEMELCFGVLVSLYHIRKLLSSHGIRPAYEMLEERLQPNQSFARYMSKNEDIRRVKLLMQQSLSHGAPSPKLSKMLEVLVDHFKAKDPKNSRVIIFSSFRGSVRDIMGALANLGDLVKATEFIGQSSGKTLKGQSQKVQQAVLEKFRAGGYNIIVATSIGEEGLDIMEVDLVICFDANVSPLRMIQRMGRTGRKNDGQVVVLACEGSELRAYMRKKASSKAIKKHMRNGGMNSFNFHPSPRMIPHIFKPEVQFVELSIEQFVSRGKKVKDAHAIETPAFKEKLTVAEADLIAKYFHPTSDNILRPSLIAFPHCQAFPSRVHNVMHSYRTGMLIDMMQHLQGLTFSGESITFFDEEEVSSGKCLGVQTAEQCEYYREDSLILDNFYDTKSPRKVTDSELSSIKTLRTKEKHSMPHFYAKSPAAHSYLFGSDFVSVDALGKVVIVSIPEFPLKEISNSKCIRASSTVLLNHLKQDSLHLKTSDRNYDERTMQAEVVAEPTTSQTTYVKNGALPLFRFCGSDAQQGEMLNGLQKILGTPILNRNEVNEGDVTSEALDFVEIRGPSPPADEHNNDLRDTELSPRLTNFIKSGVVPESPINENGLLHDKGRNGFLIPDLVSRVKLCSEQFFKSSSPRKNERGSMDDSASGRNVSVSPDNNEIQTPLLKMNHIASAKLFTSSSPVAEDTKTPLINLTNSSWSADKSENIEPPRKLKRLRKVADCGTSRDSKNMEEKTIVKLARSCSVASPIRNKHGRGEKKPKDNARAFIEEEAEVSQEAEISDDEEEDLDNNSYDDSFIDDRVNLTAACTQAESSGIDMMAIYRRSLLTQSPMERQLNSSETYSPDYAAPMTRINESGGSSVKSGGSSVKTLYSVQTPQTESAELSACKSSTSFQINQQRTASEAMPCKTSDLSREYETNMESRKRKLTFNQSGSMPAINLEREFSLQSEAAGRVSCQQGQADNANGNGDSLDDDQFYEDLDLDAVEEQAALLLKQKSECSVHKEELIPQSQNLGFYGSPSFDLGI